MKPIHWLLIVAGIALLGTGGKVIYDKTRGLRNNNPFNIRYTGTRWDGLQSEPKDDKGFCKFINPFWGIRAGAKLLRNYHKLHGLNTVAGIVSRFAPSNENDTSSYIESVSGALSVDGNQVINMNDAAVIQSLAKAIIKHENGVQPYSDNEITGAVSEAFKS